MKKVLWFSRHSMTEAQNAALQRIYGNINVNQIDRTIQSVSDIKADIDAADVIAIVAPLPLQKQFLEAAGNKPVIFAKTDRIVSHDGGKTSFVFSGWYRIRKIEVVTEKL